MGLLSYAAYLALTERPAINDDVGDMRPEVVFFDVGQGDATLIEEGNTQILIDGGDGQDILNRLGQYMPYADRRIELVIVSHPDEDHMGGLIKVLENYEVDRVLEPGIACDKSLCKKWDGLIAQKQIPTVDAKLGVEILYGGDIDLDVLYPFEDLGGKIEKETNSASVVLKATVAGRRYLFTGDAESEVEEQLLRSNLDLGADVLKVAHHGSKNATSAAFLMAVKPKEAVISVGKNAYGHPTQEVLTRLSNMGVTISRTDQKASIAF